VGFDEEFEPLRIALTNVGMPFFCEMAEDLLDGIFVRIRADLHEIVIVYK